MDAKGFGRGRARNSTILLGVAFTFLVLVIPLVSAQPTDRWAASVTPVVTHGPLACAVGTGPLVPAFDPVTREMYVPNNGGGNITVLNGTCHVVGTILLPTGNGPVAAAFDPATDKMYVTDDYLDQVYVILGMTVQHTIRSSLLNSPYDLLWDPGDGVMLVSNTGGDTVVAIAGTSVLGAVTVGSDPHGMCYDPFFATVLVLNYGVGNVTILNALDPLATPLANVGISGSGNTCVFDPADEHDYIAVVGGLTPSSPGNVTVMTGDGFVITTLTVGLSPNAIGWDQAKLVVYVADTTGTVSTISGYSVLKTTSVGAVNPYGIEYDAWNEKMYVASFTNDTLYVLG
jgi:DNA-binding beta-propeller fold protein YncE